MKFIFVILLVNSIILITLASMTPEEAAYEAMLAELDDPNGVNPEESTSVVHTDEEHYGYGPNSKYPPSKWSLISQACSGDRQSPIDIRPRSCKRERTRIKFNRFYTIPSETTCTNLGHTVQCTFKFDKTGPTVIIRNNTYFLGQAHFHFGETDNVGSEHTLNNYAGSMESHFVFYNGKYGDAPTASQKPDGLTVVGTVNKVKRNTPKKIYTENFNKIIQPGQSFTIKGGPGYSLLDIMGRQKTKYVHYDGSLTTPPCSQSVTWLVALRFEPISPYNMADLRALRAEDGQHMAGDYRPRQPRNGRVCRVF